MPELVLLSRGGLVDLAPLKSQFSSVFDWFFPDASVLAFRFRVPVVSCRVPLADGVFMLLFVGEWLPKLAWVVWSLPEGLSAITGVVSLLSRVSLLDLFCPTVGSSFTGILETPDIEKNYCTWQNPGQSTRELRQRRRRRLRKRRENWSEIPLLQCDRPYSISVNSSYVGNFFRGCKTLPKFRKRKTKSLTCVPVLTS